MEKTSLIYTKTVKVLEYEKNNNDYWDRTKLY